jgi:endosialidase-like protein
MSTGGTTQATQSQNTSQLPPWVNDAAQQNYALAQNVAQQPLQQYQGQMVADPGDQMQQAWNTAASGGNAGQDQYNAAQAGYLGVMGQTPQNVTAGQLSSTNLQPYMNPYTQNVINTTLPVMQQNLALSQNQQQNTANSANAFGGSRQAIQQGVTQAQGAQGMAQMAAQLNQANFGQAQTAAQSDIATNLAAQTSNQSAQQNQAALNNQAASGLTSLGNAAQQGQLQNFGEQVTAGSLEQQQAQNQINAQMQKFQQAWAYPGQQLGVLQSALGMTPYGQSQTGTGQTTTTTSPDYAMSALGGLGMLGGLFSGGSTSAASGIGSALGSLSDRSMKTDITKVGVHKPTKLPVYAYRYKGDPKSYPKVVGPMAEDVGKAFGPGAVAQIPGSGGKMAVHPAIMGAIGMSPGGLPPLRPRGVSLPTPNLGAIASGPLASPVPMNGVGALGRNMGVARGPTAGRPRMPQIRGALGG